MKMTMEKQVKGNYVETQVYIPYILRKTVEQVAVVEDDMKDAQERALEVLRQKNENTVSDLLAESNKDEPDKRSLLELEVEMKELSHCVSVVVDDDIWEFLWELKKEDLKNKAYRNTYVVQKERS